MRFNYVEPVYEEVEEVTVKAGDAELCVIFVCHTQPRKTYTHYIVVVPEQATP